MIIILEDAGYFNYYHWMVYMLSKLVECDIIPEIIYAPLPDNDSFQQHSLKILFPTSLIKNSIHDKTYLEYCQSEIFKLSKLKGIGNKGAVDKIYTNYLRLKLGFNAEKTESHEYIYISRKLNNQSNSHYGIEARHIKNEELMMKSLEPLGFKYVLLENMSLEKQMGLFKYAKIIISPHGAALVNACFCMQEAHVIEVTPTSHILEHFSSICEQFNINYTRFTNVEDIDYYHNMLINIPEIVNLINKIVKL